MFLNNQSCIGLLRGLFISVLFLAGCGGGSTDVAGIEGTGQPGLSKTSVGTITSTGDFTVNGVQYDVSQAAITVDGVEASVDMLSKGQVVVINGPVDEGGAGIAENISFMTNVLGPIGLIDEEFSFTQVLGQLISVDQNTVFEGVSSLFELGVNDIIQVSGYVSSNNQIVASHIKKLQNQDEFVVTGLVSELDVDQMTFRLEGVTVDYSELPLPPLLSEGILVEVKGSLVEDNGELVFLAGSVQEIIIELGNSGDKLQLQGLITRFESPSDFDVSKVPARLSEGVQFFGGHIDNLEVDVRIIVDGVFDDNGVLVIDRIDFFSGIFRHVDKNHPDASDDNPGTRELPWKTIQRAVSTAFPGDTIIVYEGVYKEIGGENDTNFRDVNEGIGIKTSGQLGRPITLRAARGQSVIIDQDYEAQCMTLYGVSYILIKGFEMRECYAKAVEVNYRNADYSESVATNIRIEDNHIHHIDGMEYRTGAISFDGVGNSQIKNNLIHDIYNNGEISQSFGGDGTIGITMHDVYNNIIVNNEIHTVAMAVYHNYPNETIRAGSSIKNNIFHDLAYGIFYRVFNQKGFVNESVSNNIFYNIYKISPFSDGIGTACIQTSVHLLDGSLPSRGLTINNNIFHKCYLEFYGYKDITIKNNIFYQVNKAIDNSPTHVWNIRSGNAFDDDQKASIVYSDYNFFSDLPSFLLNRYHNEEVREFLGLSSWQAATSDVVGLEFNNPDINSTSANPAFIDVISRDYRLLPGSPAAVAGENGKPVGPYVDESDVIGYKKK